MAARIAHPGFGVPRFNILGILAALVCITMPFTMHAQADPTQRESMYQKYLHFSSQIHGGLVRAHWMDDGVSFWYVDDKPGDIELYKVASSGAQKPLFDVERLRASLAPLLGKEMPAHGLPFQDFSYANGGHHIHFAVAERKFDVNLDNYEAKIDSSEPSDAESNAHSFKNYIGQEFAEIPSPDHKSLVSVKDANVWLRSAADGQMTQITTTGEPDNTWDGFHAAWSPDSSHLAMTRIDMQGVKHVPIVPWLSKDQDTVAWSFFPRAGEQIFRAELDILDVNAKKTIKVNTGEIKDHYIVILGWRADGSEVLFCRADRESKRLDLMAANPSTGSSRIVLTETSNTFIEGMPYDDRWVGNYTPLKDGKHFIWRSQKDGWTHLYLRNLDNNDERQLTKGRFSVVRTVYADDAGKWIYFLSHDEKHPYDTKLYRVTLDGANLTCLTDADGEHFIQFAPSGKYFLDTHSSFDTLPSTEMRGLDGKVIQVVSKADPAFLKELQWKAPEPFIVKAADAQTDLYGILYKPHDFDLAKRYPVIEYIYAGPFTASVPHDFASDESDQFVALAQLGFIVFVVDARGTTERSKAFQDVMYGNMGRYEIPDHVAALKEVAAQRSYMDMSRVGIFGISWGGYFATRAMLTAPDVYKVAVASSPATDMRGLAMVSIENYMGEPEHNEAGYDYGSNVKIAGNLQGKLLLVAGTSDANAPFSQMMQFVDALVKADKRFDLLIFPEQPHVYTGHASEYWFETIRRYFVTNLQPDHGPN